MDDSGHQKMIDEGGSENYEQKQIEKEKNESTPVFSNQKMQDESSFFPNPSNSDYETGNLKVSNNKIASSHSNNKGGGFFSFPLSDQCKEFENNTNWQKNNSSGCGLSLNVAQFSYKDSLNEPNENIPINTIQTPPPQQQTKKKAFNLFLPIAEISKAEKEIPLQTDGNSQKKKQNVFTFYDNFHEYTVCCDVAMKKCSRENQEDRFQAISPLDDRANNDAFFAVFDGHGTSAIADIVKENLHMYIVKNENYPKNIEQAAKESFKKIDEEILKKQQDEQIGSGGTTALCCLIKEDQLYIINCGDSSSVLVTNENEVKVLNKLHKPSLKEEQERLTQKNAIFTEQRVVGSLAITRALGDLKHKEYIISEPEIAIYKIDENSKYCLLGTDGFWDIVNYQDDLPELLRKRDNMYENQDMSMKDLSTYLVEIASGKRTTQKKDNMTLLAIDLNWYYRQNLEAKESNNQSMQSMQGSNCVMCSKSQIKINTEISSFIFQVKSPHSVGRSTEKKFTLNSYTQARVQQADTKTCAKPIKKKQFFGSENTEEEVEEESNNKKNDEMNKLDSLLLTTNSSIQLQNNNINVISSLSTTNLNTNNNNNINNNSNNNNNIQITNSLIMCSSQKSDSNIISQEQINSNVISQQQQQQQQQNQNEQQQTQTTFQQPLSNNISANSSKSIPNAKQKPQKQSYEGI